MTSARADDTVIRAGWIVPQHGPPLSGGSVRICRGQIVEVSSGGRPRPPGRRLIDLPHAVVIPGLVNAHTHLEFSDTAKPLEAEGGLPAWIGRVIALRRTRDAEAAATAIRRGLAESAGHGVTAIGEIGTAIPALGYSARGPRLRVFREALGLGPLVARRAARMAVRDAGRLAAAGVAAGLSPHAPYSVATGLGRSLVDAARRLHLPLAMHLAESRAEAELLRAGSGPFRDLFERLGVWPAPPDPQLLSLTDWVALLARGQRGIVVHGTYLAEDENAFRRLVRHRGRLCVAVCPRTTRALSGRLPPVRLLRDAGVRVAIGTDSRASTPDLSVLAECRTLVDAGEASPEETLRMATTDGAWALGFERSSGILAAGRSADLAILAATAPPRDPFDAILDPGTRVVATLRAGRVIAGGIDGLTP